MDMRLWTFEGEEAHFVLHAPGFSSLQEFLHVLAGANVVRADRTCDHQEGLRAQVAEGGRYVYRQLQVLAAGDAHRCQQYPVALVPTQVVAYRLHLWRAGDKRGRLDAVGHQGDFRDRHLEETRHLKSPGFRNGDVLDIRKRVLERGPGPAGQQLVVIERV